MLLNYFFDIFKKNKNHVAIIWRNQKHTYGWIIDKFDFWLKELRNHEIVNGTVVAVHGDFSPNAISLLLALIKVKAIVVPMTDSIYAKRKEYLDIAECEIIIEINSKDEIKISKTSFISKNKYYHVLKNRESPGLVLFSSGSTGKSKASVHDLSFLLEKFKVQRHKMVVITFLLYDHIGGFNTLFYVLSNGGTIVTVEDRTPAAVLSLIEKYNVELLPTSPTFLNLIILSEDYKKHNLRSLKMITYGTEPMPQVTLTRLNEIFPDVKFIQTYGLSEIGILRSKSKSSKSLWVKVGGENFKTRVVDGLLEIKAKSSMLGYLNAKSPFTDDGWFKTGDSVDVDGDYIKIIGRKSEIINVGGEKVYPQEIENVILSSEEIEDVSIYSEKNPIIGNIICAKIKIKKSLVEKTVLKNVKKLCYEKLDRYKVPVKMFVANEKQHTDRFKKQR